jgi:hypothetical protein
LEKERVSVTGRGVWHLLWEAFVGTTCTAANPTRLKIKELFSYCPEIGIEYEKSFGGVQKFVDLDKPDILYDEAADEAWIRFSVHRRDLKLQRMTAPALLRQIQSSRTGYTEVKATEPESRTFQSTVPTKVTSEKEVLAAIRGNIAAFNAFVRLRGEQELDYCVPIQNHLPIRMPQVLVLYTILFWLGSLVRYDPHSVENLMDSRHWILLDGFMSQSRVWLLELFEWAFHEVETTLYSAR